jgi:hypothetical protein
MQRELLASAQHREGVLEQAREDIKSEQQNMQKTEQLRGQEYLAARSQVVCWLLSAVYRMLSATFADCCPLSFICTWLSVCV